MKTYRTLWISDVHLGTKDCQAELLNDFLKHHHAQKLYLVGDIIDGWKMQSGIYWKKEFTRVIRRLLNLSKKGVAIDYITGNHDEFLRRFANNRFDNINLYNRVIHTTADGRKLLVIHGDQFDSVTRCHHWLRFLGNKGHTLLMALNRGYNSLRAKYGHGYWSLASFLKTHLPQAQMYIQEYEQGVAHAAAKQGFDGVVCGHIHHAASKRIGDIDYYNTGDWVESCTALAENADGTIHLINWRTGSSDSLTDGQDNKAEPARPFPQSVAARLSGSAPTPPDLDSNDAAPKNDPKIPALIIPG
ncbi:UDP-2,3-diacylglucosamine diphosphatase [Aestuariicella hydrocarbonica]|uniref:UDP-2,3-diacylglucosamine diphosphatase n=1 Tax=Pseudomaricurvus hydrocarbonicus TaxID=1470433 RepID=A0A9E5JT34_9GAMM|nr:UDP-2,3-diacylglucosamine diphosphatase [Aestuariicella hydrocarbonica]NHO64125.1 UDP-2,3-diacylglucosamine diphosphatase [Aestuariicella hydrocarbonica]